MTDGLLLRIPSVDVPERVHPTEHLVFWQVRGQSELHCEGSTTTLHEGDAAWVPVGTRHSLHVGEDSIITPLSIHTTGLQISLTRLTVVHTTPHDKLYLLALWNSQSTIIQPDANLERHIAALIERAANSTDLPMPCTPEAAAVARAILLNPADDRRTDEWAHQACMSGRSLERAFATETGLSFGQWRKACRMLAAERLLKSGEPVLAVAYRVGYENASSFARAFRQFHGVRPRDCAAATAA